jgi:hypothetical protein
LELVERLNFRAEHFASEVAGLAERYDLDYIGNGHDATALTRVIGRKAAGS